MIADDQLQGSARPLAPGKIDAVLEFDRVLVGAECPHFLVWGHQHDAMPIGQARRPHRGMKVKANGELIALAAHPRFAVGIEENVLPFEPHAVV